MAYLGLPHAQEARRMPIFANVLVEQKCGLGLLFEPSPSLSGFSCPIPLVYAAIYLVGFLFPTIFPLGWSTSLVDELGWGRRGGAEIFLL